MFVGAFSVRASASRRLIIDLSETMMGAHADLSFALYFAVYVISAL